MTQPVTSTKLASTISTDIPVKNESTSFKQLPVEIIQKIATYLPLPDLQSYFFVEKHINRSIGERVIKEAQSRVSFNLCNMEKYETSSEDIRQFNECIFNQNYISYTLNDKGEVNENIGKIRLDRYLARFGIPEYSLFGKKIYTNSQHYIKTGILENGQAFIMAPNKWLSDRFIVYSTTHEQLVWKGDFSPSMSGNICFDSFYLGETLDDALQAYEMAFEADSDVARYIREKLGFQKIYY